jgi:hypothetical protein
MARTLRPLSLGKILDETFEIYRRNFVLFVGISAIPNIALLLLQLGLAGLAIGGTKPSGGALVLAALGTIIASLVAGSIVTAATTFGVSDVYLETPTSMAACFSRVAGKALSVAYVSFVVGLIVGLGTLLCIIPGIYWAGVYGIAIPAVVLENITGNESLKRSSSLTKDSVGRVIVVYFLTSIFVFGMLFALDAGLTALGLTAFHGTGMLTQQAWQEIISALGRILFGPITAIALTLVYYDQRVRKEAFDIEHMMRLMAAPENPVSGTSAL